MIRLRIRPVQTETIHARRRNEMRIIELDQFRDLVKIDKRGNLKFELKAGVKKKAERLSEPIAVIGQVSEIKPFRPIIMELTNSNQVSSWGLKKYFYAVSKFVTGTYTLTSFAISTYSAFRNITAVAISSAFMAIAGMIFTIVCHIQQGRCKSEEENAKSQFLKALQEAAPFLRSDKN